MNVSTQADLLEERKMDVRTFVSKGKVTTNIKNNMVVINDHFYCTSVDDFSLSDSIPVLRASSRSEVSLERPSSKSSVHEER